jgi:hypothetical protein
LLAAPDARHVGKDCTERENAKTAREFLVNAGSVEVDDDLVTYSVTRIAGASDLHYGGNCPLHLILLSFAE